MESFMRSAVLMCWQLVVVGRLLTGTAWADEAPARNSGVSFDLKQLSQTPEVFPAEGLQVEGVKAFYYAGLPYRGKPTRVFAYYGVPQAVPGDGAKKFPAM